MNAPLGIFDSGLGGLTVAAALREALPREHLIYLGDTARVPYGTRSPATIVRYARNNVAFLRKQGVKMVVVACNTVSAQGLDGLTDGGDVPVIGVIRPGARAAIEASAGGPIAVLGTAGTIRSGAYVQAIHELDPDRAVVPIACPLFVPLVEEGWVDHVVTTLVAREYLAPLRGTGVDTIILGCTHYPLLEKTIAAVATEVLGHPVTLVDSAHAVARDVAALLARMNLSRREDGAGDRRFCVTDAPDRVGDVAARFWGDAVPRMEHVDVMNTPEKTP
jgi:glutamate racemase